ncbi:ankyrin repeat and EF-hand domain-containing protein 1-like [Pelodytes ibericus]
MVPGRLTSETQTGIQRKLMDFVWLSKQPRIPRKTIYLESNKDGLGMPNLMELWEASMLMHTNKIQWPSSKELDWWHQEKKIAGVDNLETTLWPNSENQKSVLQLIRGSTFAEIMRVWISPRISPHADVSSGDFDVVILTIAWKQLQLLPCIFGHKVSCLCPQLDTGASVTRTIKMRTAKGRLETLQIYKMIQCVLEQDKAQIEKMIKLGVHDLINITEPQNGNGALHIAALKNNVDMCKFLLRKGAHPDILDIKGCTPAMKATEHGHDLVLKILAAAQADMTMLNKEGKGLLFYCISPSKRHLRCLRIVLDGGADVNNCTVEGIPVLYRACEQARDCKELCLSLLEKGANPKALNPATGRTALMEAAREGALEVVRAILERGGDVDIFDKQRYHAVHFAAKGGYLEILKVLSAYSADIGIIAMDGNTALHHAASGGFADCCTFLGQRGCNPNWKNVKSQTPEVLAKEGGFKAAMKEIGKTKRIVRKYSKPGVQNPNPPWAITLHDWSFEHQKALRKSFEVFDHGDGSITKQVFATILKEKKAPVTPEQLETIIHLHEKSRAGTINTEEFLKGSKYLEKKFLMSAYEPKKKEAKQNKKGKDSIPIPICVMPSNSFSRREDGGPPNYMIRTFHNITDANRFDCDHPPQNPLTDDTGWYMDDLEKTYSHIHCATKTGDMQSLKKAIEEGVPVDVKDKFYKTPLMSACAYGNIDVVKFLLKKGARVNATDNFLWTPLHHACQAGQEDIADLLIKNGAKIDAVAFNGSTPLMRAVESGSLNCLEYLIKSGANVQIMNKKGQNVLDVARAYADYRLIHMIKAKLDSLPKTKDKQGKHKGKMEGKARGTSASKPQTPAITEAHAKKGVLRPSDNLDSRKEKKNNIVELSNLITTGATTKVDITFVPKSVWITKPTSADLIRKRELRRERFSYEVDFKNFKMPFGKNLMEKSLALGNPESICA